MDDASIDAAVRAAFAAKDGEALHALSKAHRSLAECGHEAPWLHRIGDVARVPRGSVRLLRCAACQGRLYLRRQAMRAAAAPGLSIDLSLDEQLAYVAQVTKERGAAPRGRAP